MNELLTPLQAAEYMKIPQKTLAQWRWKKKGPPYFRVGRLIRYPTTELSKWLELNASSHE